MNNLLITWSGPVDRAWVDYNGHLNDAYYLVIFSLSTDALMAHIGLDAAGRAATGHTMYTLEVHLNYVQEVHAGVAVEVRTQILGVDAKRVHVFNTLHRQDDGTLLATNEQMLANIDTSNAQTGPRTAAFAPKVAAVLLPLAQAHATLPRPANAGRSIALPAPKTQG
ncbi:4-hydroxybenzoyl-CoA thioesterase [Rhodoferax lacus]|uniref:4-hydroxybenzoyl-CoA thioesterase n=1 Tax=Rhodoferax lacus TaxID=2184758 RepID=A0A3E1RFX5_9BURK|nr:thioesterase family protein [Rhodoferax lacus]RFO98141.1 4-hydroxybenzoyl-CoA thioesterase [Rhodoferax lacus]